MKIVKRGMIQNVNIEKFIIELKETMDEMQEDNQEVEVQYNPFVLPDGEIIYNALVLGRRK